MKNASVAAKKLTALLKRIGTVEPPALPSSADPVATLIQSLLLWESTTEKATAAYARLMEHLVDYNDLRVCMPHETVDIIGPRYPRALERCQRLRAVLRNVFLREHAIKLDRLPTTGKREIKKYIESLEGIVPYAAARSLLLSFDVHIIPVDDQLRAQLIEADVCDASVEIPELMNWLTTQAKQGEGAAVHYALQAWIDDMADGGKGGKKSSKSKSTAKREQRSGAKAAAN